MIDKSFAETFAAEWLSSWNSHKLDSILAHYAEDFEFSSPVIVQFLKQPSGTIKGKAAVGAYWAKGLSARPDLHFEFQAVLAGVNSLVIHYKGLGGRLAAEFFEFGADGKVVRSLAHYAG
ncbi:MAG: nuclear transport factor 2 family protein [Nevskia sp.]